VRIRFRAFEGGDLKKHGAHLLLDIPQLNKVSLSLDFCGVIHFTIPDRGCDEARLGSRVREAG